MTKCKCNALIKEVFVKVFFFQLDDQNLTKTLTQTSLQAEDRNKIVKHSNCGKQDKQKHT